MYITYSPRIIIPHYYDGKVTANALITDVLHSLETQSSGFADVTLLLTDAIFTVERLTLAECMFTFRQGNSVLIQGSIQIVESGILTLTINGKTLTQSKRPEIIAEHILKTIEESMFFRDFS